MAESPAFSGHSNVIDIALPPTTKESLFPINDDLSLSTPRVLGAISANNSPPWPAAGVTGLPLATEPGALKLPQVLSPMQELDPANPLDTIVGATINPAPLHSPPVTLSARPTSYSPPIRARRDLRLPSFSSLGIGNPRPAIPQPIPVQDSISAGVCGQLDRSASPESDISILATHGSSFDPPSSPKAQARVPAPSISHDQFVNTLTPPEDNQGSAWHAIRVLGAGSMDSPVTDTGSSARSPEAQALTTAATSVSTLSAQPRIQVQRSDSDTVRGSWLDQACDAMMSNRDMNRHLDIPVKVLSHALPCPSNVGFAYPVIINSLHNQTPGSSTCWINAFHALPGRYNLSELPTSPPGTPGPAIGGDDYFTSKVFDSAVPVLDYQEDLKSIPQSPRPVVPPASIDVSIVERYIPPTNVNEFSELFSVSGRSLLADRLVELSPQNGTLLFVYPTRAGAQTFTREYLGPILDPLLRSMCIINGLSVDLGSSLSKMAVVDSMHSFESLKAGIIRLCGSLGARSRALERFHGKQAKFTLQFSSKEQVSLDRTAWAENWWIKQEKPRVREVVSKYFRLARKMPVDADVTPTALIHEVLNGVARRPYGNAPEPTTGVEVGVFVIKRSA